MSDEESVDIDLTRLREVASGCGWSLAELSAFYTPRAQAEVRGVSEALAAGDLATVARLAHGAAGSSATLGMDSLATRFRAISADAPRLSSSQLTERIADVDGHLARVLARLAELVRSEL